MANYLTTDTDLTAVADAIREKGGTSAQLAFPDGFVDAIDAIETGGGDARLLHFETFVPTERYYNGNYLYKNLIPSSNCVIAVFPSSRPETNATYAQALFWLKGFINRPDMTFNNIGGGYLIRTTGVQGTDGDQCNYTPSTGVLRMGSAYTSYLPGVEYIIIQVDMEVPE